MIAANSMRAFVLRAPGDLAVETCPVPAPGPGQALVRSKLVGICGSDIHAYHGLQPSMVYPSILGHEIYGEIVELNSEDQKLELKPGDRVVIDPSIVCGMCFTCSIGRWNVCENLKVLGVHKDGGFADFFIANINQLHKVPDEISDRKAVLAEPLSIAAQAVDRGRIQKDEDVVIFGAGPIGLATLALVKNIGSRAAVVDLLPNRLTVAKEIGADEVIDARGGQDQVIRQIYEFSRGPGPQVIVDAVAVKQTAHIAVESLARAGRLVVLGLASPEVSVPYLQILKKELDVIGSRMTRGKFPEIIRFLQESRISDVLADKMITHVFPFEDIAEAFSLVEKSPEKAIKVVISF